MNILPALAVLFGIFIGYLTELFVRYLPTRSIKSVCSNCCEESEFNLNIYYMTHCKMCAAKPSRRSFIILALSVIGSVLIAIYDPLQNLLFGWGILFYFLILVFIDIEHHLILHSTTLFGLFFGTIVGMALHGFKSSIIGGAFGLVFIGLFYILGIFYAKFKNRGKTMNEGLDEALGFGDVTLATVLGLLLGHAEVFPALILGIFLAGGYSMVLIIKMILTKKYDSHLYIPYGPFLIFGAVHFIFNITIF